MDLGIEQDLAAGIQHQSVTNGVFLQVLDVAADDLVEQIEGSLSHYPDLGHVRVVPDSNCLSDGFVFFGEPESAHRHFASGNGLECCSRLPKHLV